jgi:hypothetical protein
MGYVDRDKPLTRKRLARPCMSIVDSIWPAGATLSLLLLIMCGATLGGYDQTKWPVGAFATLNHQPTAARLFHEQDWGGLIAADCQPARRSYLDDRFELFGKEAIVEYVDALTGGRPRLGHGPRPRRNRDGLASARSGIGEAASERTRLGGALS